SCACGRKRGCRAGRTFLEADGKVLSCNDHGQLNGLVPPMLFPRLVTASTGSQSAARVMARKTCLQAIPENPRGHIEAATQFPGLPPCSPALVRKPSLNARLQWTPQHSAKDNPP